MYIPLELKRLSVLQVLHTALELVNKVTIGTMTVYLQTFLDTFVWFEFAP